LRVRLRLLLRSTRPSPFYLAAFYNGGSWQAIAALPPHRTTWPRRARSAVREGLRRAGQLAYGTVRILGVRSLDRRVARGHETSRRWQEAPKAVLRWIGSRWAPGHGCGLARSAHGRTHPTTKLPLPLSQSAAQSRGAHTWPRRQAVGAGSGCHGDGAPSGACGRHAGAPWMARETAAGLAAIVRMRAFSLEPPFRSLISGVASVHTRRG